MRKRRIIVKRRTKGTVDEWERGWALAMTRIEGAHRAVKEQPIFQDCLTVLDGAFADGNHLRFELGLNALMDFCTDMIIECNCERWWKEEEAT